MNRIRIALLLAGGLLVTLAWSLQAQTNTPTPEPPQTPQAMQQHVVAAGENLTLIAEAYDVSVNDLMVVNNFRSSDILSVGRTLLIPGGAGEEVATVYRAELGDSLTAVAARFDTTPEAVANWNRAINPFGTILNWGQPLGVISHTGTADPLQISGFPHLVKPGETLSSIAAQYNVPILALADENGLSYPSRLFPGQRLRIPGTEPYQFLPGEWAQIEIAPDPITPGATVVIFVESFLDGQPQGEFEGRPLRFIPHEGGYAALLGVDAFTPPGRYALTLSGEGSRSWTPLNLDVPVAAAGYVVQQINVDDALSDLLDPELRADEDDFLHTIYANDSGDPMWEDVFQVPITGTVTARYGDGRSYNEGPVEIYHSGVDFDGTIGTLISAPARGKVIFNAWLELRGLTLIIDHGLGVMTGYYHLSESYVNENDIVEAGQPIAAGGSSGLSTGPHLHWDLRIMDIPVDGMRWTERPFP